MKCKAPNVEITKAAAIAAGTTEAYPWGADRTAPLPAYCRIEGVINRRTGVDGEAFGITFALAMPENWNGDFRMQGGAGSNVMQPLGLNAAGDKAGLIRGFAFVSTDTGHKSHHPGFDFAFVKDEQANLDFAYLANAEVATLAKQIIARYYAKPAATVRELCRLKGNALQFKKSGRAAVQIKIASIHVTNCSHTPRQTASSMCMASIPRPYKFSRGGKRGAVA